MTTQRTHLSRALTVLLCILMLLSLAMPVGAASGHWKEVKIRTSYGNVSTHAYVLDSPAKNCASFDLDVEIEMKKNTSCANWDIWIRSNGSFVNVASLSLSGGNGSASKTVKLKPARDFDAVAITPTKRGNYSWSLGMAVSNISGSSSDNSSGSSSDNSDSSSESITPDESSQSVAADTSAVPSSPESITDSSNMGSDSAPQEESGGSDIVIWIIVLGVIIVILVAVDIANVVLMRKNKK